MIGHEYKNRAAEPLFAAEAFEKEAECVVVVSHALVDFGVAVGQRVFVSGGYDERMVRREGEERGEEGFRGFGKLLAHELQERFVPDAPVAVEILFAMPGFVILAADEPLHAGRTGIGAEAHRAALRTAEKRRGVTFVAQDGRQLPAFAQRLRHQHERRLERRDAAQYRRHGLNRAGAVCIHPFEAQPAAHQRVEERREAFGLSVGIDFGHQVRRMFG